MFLHGFQCFERGRCLGPGLEFMIKPIIAYSTGRFHAGFMRGSCAGHKNCHVPKNLELMGIVIIYFTSTMISIGFNRHPWYSLLLPDIHEYPKCPWWPLIRRLLANIERVSPRAKPHQLLQASQTTPARSGIWTRQASKPNFDRQYSFGPTAINCPRPLKCMDSHEIECKFGSNVLKFYCDLWNATPKSQWSRRQRRQPRDFRALPSSSGTKHKIPNPPAPHPKLYKSNNR